MKTELAYPRTYGHDIRVFSLINALANLGHAVGLATVDRPNVAAIEGLHVDFRVTLHDCARREPARSLPLAGLQARFASYFGNSQRAIEALADAVFDFHADVLIGAGPDILPYLAATPSVRRVWYAADEWVSHYWSIVKVARPHTWQHLRTGAVWGLYERAFAPSLDRVWVVSEPDARAMRRWAGAAHVDVLPNGVDAEYFCPQGSSQRLRSAVFWGRLDFSPNLQALEWFCREVWPALRERFPDALFRIIGFGAGADARALAQLPGVVLSPDVADLRPTVAEHAVVVMPFRSGRGIKNKLLEAASMSKAIVCTPMACSGLRGTPPVVMATRPREWLAAISRLWTNQTERENLGTNAREWVLREHSWRRTATDAIASLATTSRTAAP